MNIINQILKVEKVLSFIVLCTALTGTKLWAQSYRVEVTVTSISTTGCDPLMRDVVVRFAGINEFTDIGGAVPIKVFDRTFPTRPATAIEISTSIVGCDSNPSYRCVESSPMRYTGNVDFATREACTAQRVNVSGTCSTGSGQSSSISVRFEIKWSPVYDAGWNGKIQVSSIDNCEDENVTLSIPSTFTGYACRYRDTANPTFRALNTSPGTSGIVSVGIDDIYGPSYQSKLGNSNSILFETKIGSCPAITSVDPVHFQPKMPFIEAESVGFTLTTPECDGMRDTVRVIKVNRELLASETLTIKIFRRSDNVIT
jgi:hypothetical protein